MGKVVAIVNHNGGVGKTTTAINLAKSFASHSLRVLLVDFDPMSNIGEKLGLSSENHTTLLDCINAGKDTLLSLVTTDEGIDLLPNNVNLIGFEIDHINAPDRERILSNALNGVTDRYDYVVLDTPSSLGLLTINALAAADYALIPVRCDYFAGEGLAELLQTIRDVKAELNPKLDLDGFVITHCNSAYRTMKRNIADIRNTFGELVFRNVVNENKDMQQCYDCLAREIESKHGISC